MKVPERKNTKLHVMISWAAQKSTHPNQKTGNLAKSIDTLLVADQRDTYTCVLKNGSIHTHGSYHFLPCCQTAVSGESDADDSFGEKPKCVGATQFRVLRWPGDGGIFLWWNGEPGALLEFTWETLQPFRWGQKFGNSVPSAMLWCRIRHSGVKLRGEVNLLRNLGDGAARVYSNSWPAAQSIETPRESLKVHITQPNSQASTTYM